MISLKAFSGVIASPLGLTPAALYERQRALVRANLLQAEKGRGPGSGVRATPRTVALLLISVLAAHSLSEVEESAPVFAALKLSRGERGPLNWGDELVDALQWALNSPRQASTVDAVDVEHTEKRVFVHFREHGKRKIVEFGKGERAPDLAFSARLRGKAIKRIADQLYAMTYGDVGAR